MSSGDPRLKDNLILRWWNSHPRYRWFISLVPAAKLLDAGAGTGGIPYWQEQAQRKDIIATAVDRSPQDWTGYYQTGTVDFEERDCLSGLSEGTFDAVLFSHVVEHLVEPANALNELFRVCKLGATIYIETPTLASLNVPSMHEYKRMHWPCSSVRFDDDATHRVCYSREQLIILVEAAGFRVTDYGVIRNRFVEQALLEYGKDFQDSETSTYGITSVNRLHHYVIAERMPEDE